MKEIEILKKINTPYKIQEFLDNSEYNSTYETRSPKYVLNNKRAHCMEGAMFAAFCLENLGFPPLILDMLAFNDDDHVIALYKINGFWGAIAKSNFTTLRFREPVYKSLRELTMSYFDFYFNTIGDKSLRAYSLPYNLNKHNKLNWRTTDNDLEEIGNNLNKIKHISIINQEQINNLEVAGDYLLNASMIGANVAGLYVPDSGLKKID
ncbi:MAG: hypothetical protein A2046_03135 [Bacteroidetes bacterium GWA2_30_7]|nr:MAG: hypothetical protein A2046_03135 [Bacteroidetes bacterium GWA2_30_7]